MRRLVGTVQPGHDNANVWLRRFAGAYRPWLGQDIYPGSLNLDTGSPFDWHSPDILPHRRTFSLLPHGGERDLYIVPCTIVEPATQPCWLWTTTTAADDRPDPHVVEVIAAVRLRAVLGVGDGDEVVVDYPGEWAR